MNAARMNAPDRALEGQVALITGGARGIGRAIVDHLAELGATVGVLDLKKELADQAMAVWPLAATWPSETSSWTRPPRSSPPMGALTPW